MKRQGTPVFRPPHCACGTAAPHAVPRRPRESADLDSAKNVTPISKHTEVGAPSPFASFPTCGALPGPARRGIASATLPRSIEGPQVRTRRR